MKNKAKRNAIEVSAKGVFAFCAVTAIFAVCSITVYMFFIYGAENKGMVSGSGDAKTLILCVR